MNTRYLTAIIGALLLGAAQLAQAVLVITPTTGVLNVSRWEGDETANQNEAAIKLIVGSSVDLTLLYTQNVGGGEAGGFASSYTTAFLNSPGDPEDATITYGSGASISGFEKLYLYVKDGNADPAFYIFDISSWNGTEQLSLQDFWVGNGAISHISILGAGTSSVPDGGATLVLLGTALTGLGLARKYLLKA
jgi:hypothetical protein